MESPSTRVKGLLSHWHVVFDPVPLSLLLLIFRWIGNACSVLLVGRKIQCKGCYWGHTSITSLTTKVQYDSIESFGGQPRTQWMSADRDSCAPKHRAVSPACLILASWIKCRGTTWPCFWLLAPAADREKATEFLLFRIEDLLWR